MIASIILAAALSSTQIDEFFTLPSWMPTTVSSSATPGSDDFSKHRLTPEVQAGILSSFAAYCERQYYASQGQSNVWDVSQFGPRNNKKDFWFDPLHDGLEFAYTPSNRVINTRRLTSYANIDGLAQYLVGSFSQNGLIHRSPARPGWIDGSGSLFTRMYWSTTDSTVLDSTDIVPSFGWTQIPTVHSSWSKCSQTFQCLDFDDVWYATHYTTDVNNIPTRNMMSALSFGQQEYDASSYNVDNCKPDLIPVMMRELIETNFPHADGCAVTNETHRLLSDRLGCINQVLGLMDRTYHVPTVEHKGTQSLYTFTHWVDSGADITLTGFQDVGSQLGYKATFGDTIPWSSFQEKHSIVTNTEAVTGGSTASFKSISATSTGASVSASGLGNVGMYIVGSDDIVRACIEDAGWEKYGDEIQVIIMGYRASLIDGMIAPVIYYMVRSPNRIGEDGYLSFSSFSQANLHLSYEYSRTYRYRTTSTVPSLEVTQPGFQAGDRAASCAFGAVVGYHKRPIFVSFRELLLWDYYTSSARYKSGTGTYASRSSLADSLEGLVSDAAGKFQEEYGIDPMNWQSIIPINGSDADALRESVDLGDVYFSIDATMNATKVTCVYDGDGLNVTSIYSYGPTVVDPSNYCLLMEPKLHAFPTITETTSQTERTPLSLEAKIGVITRVDWDWKTLKRNN